jgi:hypothetical protein
MRLNRFVEMFFTHIKDIQASHPKWHQFDVASSVSGWTRLSPAAHWLKKAGLTPHESITTVADLDSRQRNDLFNDFVQRITLFREFAAFEKTSEPDTARGHLDAKEREALFREFAKYQKIPPIIVAYHKTAVDQ